MARKQSKQLQKQIQEIIIISESDSEDLPPQINATKEQITNSLKLIQDQDIFQARLTEIISLSLLEDNKRESQLQGIFNINNSLGINDDARINQNDPDNLIHKSIIVSKRIFLALLTITEKEKDNIHMDNMNYSLLKLILFLFKDLQGNKYEFELVDLSTFLPYVVSFKQKLSKLKTPQKRGKKVTLQTDDPNSYDRKVLIEKISEFEEGIQHQLEQSTLASLSQIQTPLIVTPQIKQQAKIAIKKNKSSVKKEMSEIIAIFKAEINSSLTQLVTLYNRCSIEDEDETKNSINNEDNEESYSEQNEEETKGKLNKGKKKKKKSELKEKKKMNKDQNKTNSIGKESEKEQKTNMNKQQEFFFEDNDIAELLKSIRNQKNKEITNVDEIETIKQQKMRLCIIRMKCALIHGFLAEQFKDLKETIQMKQSLFDSIKYDGNIIGSYLESIPDPRNLLSISQFKKREIIKKYFTSNTYEKKNKQINYGMRLAFWGYEVIKHISSRKSNATSLDIDDIAEVIAHDLK
ncbi:MAG: hypothetical protein EZS28_021498 [Streblomastix strix]|uniref:Uncharacterized protein n=1 Tax=Streblomastix strix TaxID=222440 RepID=A0A5J4VK06_9EUKA|nr:MAG: hypothetical protein EZS28_021498 [Streblomastix strix]